MNFVGFFAMPVIAITILLMCAAEVKCLLGYRDMALRTNELLSFLYYEDSPFDNFYALGDWTTAQHAAHRFEESVRETILEADKIQGHFPDKENFSIEIISSSVVSFNGHLLKMLAYMKQFQTEPVESELAKDVLEVNKLWFNIREKIRKQLPSNSSATPLPACVDVSDARYKYEYYSSKSHLSSIFSIKFILDSEFGDLTLREFEQLIIQENLDLYATLKDLEISIEIFQNEARCSNSATPIAFYIQSACKIIKGIRDLNNGFGSFIGQHEEPFMKIADLDIGFFLTRLQNMKILMKQNYDLIESLN